MWLHRPIKRVSRRGRLQPALYDASLLVVAALVAMGALHGSAKSSAALRTYSKAMTVSSEISYKADQIEALAKPPQLVFFGGSRSQRFDPDLATKETGLRAFNLAVSNGRPEGAWALANWMLARAPHTRLRWIWGVQWSTFYEHELDPGLMQDERFSWYFPDDLLRGERSNLPRTASEASRVDVLRNRSYADNGLLLSNSYDARRAAGETLAESLEHYIAKARKKHQGKGHRSSTKSRAKVYFEKTLGLLNDHGTTPVIVLMPVHPAVVRALGDEGLLRNHRNLVRYLKSISDDYDFEIVDIHSVSSFDGDPSEFYDGVHMTQANSDKALKAIVKAAGGALE